MLVQTAEDGFNEVVVIGKVGAMVIVAAIGLRVGRSCSGQAKRRLDRDADIRRSRSNVV